MKNEMKKSYIDKYHSLYCIKLLLLNFDNKFVKVVIFELHQIIKHIKNDLDSFHSSKNISFCVNMDINACIVL